MSEEEMNLIKSLFARLLLERKHKPFIVALLDIELSEGDDKEKVVIPYITLQYTTLDIHIIHKFIGGLCFNNPHAIAQHIFDSAIDDYNRNISPVLQFYIDRSKQSE